MPIDLTPAGKASPYPPGGPRLLPWLGMWAACNAIGAPIGLLLWPTGVPATGTWFWFCILGIPNLLFAVLLGTARASYEAIWMHACYRNYARQKWLVRKVRQAQRPLQVLGVGYCLPLGANSLASVMIDAKPLTKAQPPRYGSGLPVHNRFDDESFTPLLVDGEDPPASGSEIKPADRVATTVLKLEEALATLAASLHALSQYGPVYAPTVRVVARPEHATLRAQQVREALRRAGLPPLECLATPVEDGLMVADAWLDAKDRRAVLVVGAEWHDSSPPVGSTEGCVAVLLNPGFYQLPEPVRVLGTLHRPVTGEANALGDLLQLALIWGSAESSSVPCAWITGLDSRQDSALIAAWKATSQEQLSEADAVRRPDHVVGDAGPLNPWLSVVAAITGGMEGPQLIMDRAQAAVLYVTPSSHDESDQ
ncbi:hypothetical protein [Cupriavidus necator]|uniref:Transmembrane protein n=1 Tax=Cupriavidus pinatubonensis (strain JMP 134 / LMG 1197) TaxID=264198 RepID=Q477N4_CUPPJ|nr:hypothetical protein [Cupriavidus necator]